MEFAQFEAYAITLCVEGVIAWALAPLFGANRDRAMLAAILGSLVTHPIVWWSFYELWPGLRYWSYGVVEGFAVGTEMIAYRLLARVSWLRALILSFVVNASSVAAGFALYALR